MGDASKIPTIDARFRRDDLPFRRKASKKNDAKAAANTAEQVSFYEDALLEVLSSPKDTVKLKLGGGKGVEMSKDAAVSYLQTKYKSAQQLLALLREILNASHQMMMRLIESIRVR